MKRGAKRWNARCFHGFSDPGRRGQRVLFPRAFQVGGALAISRGRGQARVQAEGAPDEGWMSTNLVQNRGVLAGFRGFFGVRRCSTTAQSGAEGSLYGKTSRTKLEDSCSTAKAMPVKSIVLRIRTATTSFGRTTRGLSAPSIAPALSIATHRHRIRMARLRSSRNGPGHCVPCSSRRASGAVAAAFGHPSV